MTVVTKPCSMQSATKCKKLFAKEEASASSIADLQTQKIKPLLGKRSRTGKVQPQEPLNSIVRRKRMKPKEMEILAKVLRQN